MLNLVRLYFFLCLKVINWLSYCTIFVIVQCNRTLKSVIKIDLFMI